MNTTMRVAVQESIALHFMPLHWLTVSFLLILLLREAVRAKHDMVRRVTSHPRSSPLGTRS